MRKERGHSSGKWASWLREIQISNRVQKLSSIDGSSVSTLMGQFIKCWGDNSTGQLGDWTTTNSATPVLVPGVTATAVSASSGGVTCALLSGGSVKCWGYNWEGELGNGTTTDSSTPVLVPGLTAAAVVGGGVHTCALLPTGAMTCWGQAVQGQLGYGTRDLSPRFVLE